MILWLLLLKVEPHVIRRGLCHHPATKPRLGMLIKHTIRGQWHLSDVCEHTAVPHTTAAAPSTFWAPCDSIGTSDLYIAKREPRQVGGEAPDRESG